MLGLGTAASKLQPAAGAGAKVLNLVRIKEIFRASSGLGLAPASRISRKQCVTQRRLVLQQLRLFSKNSLKSQPEDESRGTKDIPGLRHTVWEQQDLKTNYPPLSEDLRADVVVIGAGIAGTSVAYNLVKAGKSVVLLEARATGSGQTGKTTAHIMPWYDDYYCKLEHEFGLRRAKLVADSYRSALNWIEQTIKEENIDCKFTRLDGYLFAHNDSAETHRTLRKEYEASKRVGFDVSIVDLGKDPACGTIGKAILFPTSAEFHPLMYLNGLVKAFVDKGGKIYEQTRVISNQGNRVTTKEGVSVTAEAVVLATNSPINHDLTVHARQTPDRTYAIGLRVPKGSVKRANWWGTDNPYHYVRLETKDDHDVLVVGGEDTGCGMSPSDYNDPYEKLEKWTRERWTSAGEVEYRWTGEVFEPADYLHLIGPDPLEIGKKIQYIATGDSGQGMTSGTIAGILLKDMILGKHNPWAEVYDPKRIPPLSQSILENMGEEIVHTVEGIKDKLPFLGADSVFIEDLPPNSGAVAQKGLEKVAIFKDSKGKVHSYLAVCTHMKCNVKWNPVDVTFDCPCHGSIFDCYGRCINGPATTDLSPVLI